MLKGITNAYKRISSSRLTLSDEQIHQPFYRFCLTTTYGLVLKKTLCCRLRVFVVVCKPRVRSPLCSLTHKGKREHYCMEQTTLWNNLKKQGLKFDSLNSEYVSMVIDCFTIC